MAAISYWVMVMLVHEIDGKTIIHIQVPASSQVHQTGKEGYTLAAALRLRKDEVIKSVLPHYKIDALVRRVNADRYDDRDYIDTNLIDAYARLMDFTVKHLPDKFYMEGDQRVSLRAKIFREVVANLIVHREYTSGLAATFII